MISVRGASAKTELNGPEVKAVIANKNRRNNGTLLSAWGRLTADLFTRSTSFLTIMITSTLFVLSQSQ